MSDPSQSQVFVLRYPNDDSGHWYVILDTSPKPIHRKPKK